MSDTLDDLLRDLAKKGRINHITLAYSGDGKHHKFSAAFRDDRSQGYQMMQDADPVKALMYVLKGTGYKHYPGSKDKEPLPSERPKKSARDLI